MTTDNQEIVQLEGTSIEGVTPPEVTTPPEPSPEEKMVALIEQRVSEAVAKATETAKREIQSVKDRSRMEVEETLRRAQLAEKATGFARQRIQELDPEAAKELELSELKAKEAHRTRVDQEEAQRQQQETLSTALQDSLLDHLEALGIDPKDERIDWAKDSSDYVQGRGRFDASVAKIVKEERQTAQSGLETRLKELEAKVSQVSTEANSVNTATSPGVVAGSDAEFVKLFASGELPLNSVNIERYNKIVETY